MKRLFILFLVFYLAQNIWAQDFFRNDFNKRKNYIILTNPTVKNLQTICFLKNSGYLDINTVKTKFVGVYYKNQNYDFKKALDYVNKLGLKNIFFHEVRGELNEDNLFMKNNCTNDLKMIFENSVGIFFFGGPDIPPAVYGEANTRSIVTDPSRHYFELTFLFHLLGGSQNEEFDAFLRQKPRYFITGFCLGLQTMNVATGGTLIQDIPAEIYSAENPEETLKIGRSNLHRNYWPQLSEDTLLMGINLHTLSFTDNPFFNDIIKVPKRWNPRVYSSHPQAIEKLGKGLEVTALSPDGKVIEGVAHNLFPNVFAVQFHPEVPGLYVDLSKKKFHPEDEPMSYNDIIGKQSVKFHEMYWAYISRILRKAKNR